MFTNQIYKWSKKTCIAAEILTNLYFFFLGGFPIGFYKKVVLQVY